MPDLARIESDLTGRYPETWVRHHLASFRPPYFAAFDGEDIARHLGRSLALTDEQPVAVETWPEGPGAWRVEAVGFDAFQLLSTLCTLLAIHRLSIVEGHAFTSDPRLRPGPRGPPRRPPRPGAGRGRGPPAEGRRRVRVSRGRGGRRGARLGRLPGRADGPRAAPARRPVRGGPPPPDPPVRRRDGPVPARADGPGPDRPDDRPRRR